MDRRSITGVLVAGLSVWLLLAALPASGADGIRDRKAAVDAKIDTLQAKIEAARRARGRAQRRRSRPSRSKIHALEDDVGAAEARLDQLENVLALHRRKLDRLNQLFRLQTRKLVFLQRQHRAATQRLNRRIVEIYTSEPTEALTVVLEAATFSDLMDQLDYLNEIGSQDERIASEVKHAKLQMQGDPQRHAARRATPSPRRPASWPRGRRSSAPCATASPGASASSRPRDATSATRSPRCARTRRTRSSTCASSRRRAPSSRRRSRSAQAARRSARRSRRRQVRRPRPGFIWPVHGVVTSGFGWRWGRLHAGIDIAVGSGTPVVAAAGGTVVIAGWLGGYGNLVVIDHGNGIATAYGHNSGVTVGVGQFVAQGQLIAYSGSTGHSTGPHVHFEVRINGLPVDPMGYL